MTAPAIGPDPQSDRLHALRDRLGYVFQREGLLEEALTHPSFQGEAGRRRQCNERMEFLGDRVLGLVIAELLFQQVSARGGWRTGAPPCRAGAPRGACAGR